MVLLIGNYAPDRQHSMLRFANMMLAGLTIAGIAAELIEPAPVFGRLRFGSAFVAKWLAYLDKFLLFPRLLRRRVARRGPAVVHICDHSNAMYANWLRGLPTVVTCHDLLAVRGALGEATDCPASATGKLLQRWIVRGLNRANAIACVSTATLHDAQRLVSGPKLTLIPVALNYPFAQLPAEVVDARLAQVGGLDAPFVLHVGSNLRRKNRIAVLRIFARCAKDWDGKLVFAGEAVTAELRSLGEQLGVAGRIVSIDSPESELLEALYNRATALLYPSRFEGFGWPIIEAQACGCPVICSNSGPMPEVAGEAGLLHDVDDEEGFAADLLRLTNRGERDRWSAKSVANAKRFAPENMIAEYINLYRSLAPEV